MAMTNSAVVRMCTPLRRTSDSVLTGAREVVKLGFMRTSLLLLPAALAGAIALSSCSLLPGSNPGANTAGDGSPATEAAGAGQGASASAPADPNAVGDGLPVDTAAQVDAHEPCPYLDTQWLADTNGQIVTDQGLDHRFGTPACVFWSYPEAPQATVMVRDLGTVERARAAVDWAAPIDATGPVEENDWHGGRGVLGEMSVYAVQKDNIAVLVWTNQLQTIKAELIAKETIKNLGL